MGIYVISHCASLLSVHVVCVDIRRVGAQLGMTQMMTIEIEIPNRMVGLGEFHTVAQSHPVAT